MLKPRQGRRKNSRWALARMRQAPGARTPRTSRSVHHSDAEVSDGGNPPHDVGRGRGGWGPPTTPYRGAPPAAQAVTSAMEGASIVRSGGIRRERTTEATTGAWARSRS
jgi:hypothetical protein